MTTKIRRHIVKIFYSYARKDLLLKNELAKHLNDARIAAWSDSDINAGMHWEDKIDENLENADIVLLLISPDFKASKYCVEKEMKRALEREKEGQTCVIPIVLRSVYWPDPPYHYLQILKSAQSVKNAPDLDLAFTEVATEVGKIIGNVLKEKYVRDAKESVDACKYEEAYAAYEQAIGYAPMDATLQGQAGDLLITLERYDEALQMYERAIKLRPENENDRFYGQKGLVLVLLGRYEDALIAYSEAVRWNTTDFALYKRMGDTFFHLKRTNEARAKYKEALRLSSDDYQQYMSLGNVLFDMNSYQEALNAYERAENLKKDDADIYMKKGEALRVLKRHDEALAAYNRVIDLKPNDPAPRALKGYVFALRGNYPVALEAYEEALHLDSSNAQFWADKGDILEKLGSHEAAYGAYSEAISCAPNNASAYKKSGDMLYALERYREAKAAYDEAILRNPEISGWYLSRAATIDKIAQDLYDRYTKLKESAANDRATAQSMNARNTQS